MTIKTILQELAETQGAIAKKKLLEKHKENETLKRVLYMALSKRLKYYIRLNQLMPYTPNESNQESLDWALNQLQEMVDQKIRGDKGKLWIQNIMSSVSVDDAFVVERILDRQLKINMGRSEINKIIPKLIEKTPYMGAKSFSESYAEKIIKPGKAFSDIKMDGRYANAILDEDMVELVSRAGEPTVLLNACFLNELHSMGSDIVLNGELTVEGVPERRTANGIVSSLIDIQSKLEERTPEETQKKIDSFIKEHKDCFGNENLTFQDALDAVTYTCWDMISKEEYLSGKSSTPYHKRREAVKQLIENAGCTRVVFVESIEVNSLEEASAHFQDALARGLEGTILKSYDGAWKDGKPAWQIKFKLEMDLDLKIIGFQQGTPGTKNENVISTLLLESSCGLLRTNPSGMDEKMMQYVTDNQEHLLGKIVEIRCCGLSQDRNGNWSTLHPSVVEIRDDKDECDSLNSAQLAEAAAKGQKT